VLPSCRSAVPSVGDIAVGTDQTVPTRPVTSMMLSMSFDLKSSLLTFDCGTELPHSRKISLLARRSSWDWAHRPPPPSHQTDPAPPAQQGCHRRDPKWVHPLTLMLCMVLTLALVTGAAGSTGPPLPRWNRPPWSSVSVARARPRPRPAHVLVGRPSRSSRAAVQVVSTARPGH
jgi:hypothetical protein